MNKKKTKVLPKLRFQHFRESAGLSITTLGALIIPIENRAGSKKYTLMSVTSGVGLISQTEKFGREIAGNAYKNYIVIQQGDFAYNKSATKLYPEGYIAMLTDYKEAALPNSIFVCFRIVDEGVCTKYFDYLFQSNYHGSWLRKFIAVGARAHGSLNIDNKHLWEMPVALPLLPEQQKIADCLSSLDELIAAENKKLEGLKMHKKGLMQNLFPAEGKTVPEVRFPGFTDAWEQRKFNDLVFRVTTPSDNDRLPRIEYEDIVSGQGQLNKDIFEKKSDKKGIRFEPHDTLFGKLRPYLHNWLLPDFNGVAVGDFWILRPNEMNHEFIYTLIQSAKYQYVANLSTGTKMPRSDWSVVSKTAFAVPSDITEQAKIGAVFINLDHLITLHQRKLEFLRVHKDGLMQGLFPSIQEVIE